MLSSGDFDSSHVDDDDEGESEKAPSIVKAAIRGNISKVESVLNSIPGCVNERDSDESTALICAAAGGYTEIGRLLLDRAADPDLQDSIGGYTALMLATKFGYLDFVRLLVQRGASTNIVDLEGKMARDYARSEEIKKILAQVSI